MQEVTDEAKGALPAGVAGSAQSASQSLADDARRWWTSQTSDAQAQQASNRNQVYRKKSYSWLVRLDHALRSLLGTGLLAFQIPSATLADWKDWDALPVLALSCDQGSDGWSAVWFLSFYLSMSVIVFNDRNNCVHEIAINNMDCKY